MNKLSNRPVVAVDSDTLLFRAAAVCDNRSVLVTHEPTGKTKAFKNKTEFANHMKEKEKVITNEYKLTNVQSPEPISHALKIIKSGAEEILDNYIHCDVVFCAGADNNFRDSLPYPTKYKSNRANTIRPVLLGESYEYFYKQYNAKKSFNHETDDEVGIVAYEAIKQGRQAFILSPDGDSRQFDGARLGGYSDRPEDCELLEFFPKVSWNPMKKQVKSAGFPWMVMQGLVGDVSDGLNPCAICGAKYGEKTWFNAVKDFTEPSQFVDYLIEMYQKWYPNEFEYVSFDGKLVKADWKFLLDLYWKGTTMKRERNKLPDFWEFLQEKGVNYVL